MKILLLGGNGQVGHALRSSLAPIGTLVTATRNGQLDDGARCEVADLDQPATLHAVIARVAPDVVVNAAAYTAVDRAEIEPELAFRANAQAPGAIAAACAAHGALLLHYSTDYVFDGSGSRPYREDDATSPLGVYGQSKLAGEQAILASGARHCIVRTAWVYDAHGRNFLRTMLRLAAERDELRVVADQAGTPTSATLIATTSAALLAGHAAGRDAQGMYHLTAMGQTTWHGFAGAIIDGAFARGLLVRKPVVTPIDTAQFPTPARRPAYSCLDTGKLRTTLGTSLPTWQSDLDQVLARMRAD